MSTCRGIDLSVYQNAQDWAARKAEGVAFAFAKASEGEHSRDAHFKTHITGIKAAGLVPGAYHFAWPNQDVKLEAANYIAAVKPYAGAGFTHWLDLERRSDGKNYAGRSASQIKAWAAAWIAAVEKAYPGQRVGVYTSGDDLAKGHVPAGTPLWYPAYTWGYTAAGYAKAEATAQPHPSGWKPLFWQFTSTPLDRSICYLSAAELRAWAAGTPEDNMPITDADAQKIAKAVLQADIISAPPTAPDVKTNPTWRLDSYAKDTNARLRAVQATEAAQTATIATLVKTVAGLAANTAAIDPAALVAEIEAAIAKVKVTLDVSSS